MGRDRGENRNPDPCKNIFVIQPESEQLIRLQKYSFVRPCLFQTLSHLKTSKDCQGNFELRN